MMEMMEKYTNNLEDLVNQRTIAVYEEKRKTEDLLHRMLPAYVTNEFPNWIINNMNFLSWPCSLIYFNECTKSVSTSLLLND